MQPRNLPVVEALVVLDALLDVLDEAELWLLPHAAMSSVADTASAVVAHALCFTLTSTGPARHAPGLDSVRVVPQVIPGGGGCEGDTRLSRVLVAESEPDLDDIPGLPDIHPGGFTGGLGAFLQRRS